MTSQLWNRWGAELRRQRKKAGHPQATIANAINVARTTLGAFERGTRTPSRDHAVAADEALSAGGALTQLWDEINNVREVPKDWRSFENVEVQAVTIREYQSAVIPGLLQTPEYAESLIRNTGAWGKDQIERLVAVRTSRLGNLTNTSLSFVLNEEALRRAHGTWAVTAAQLDRVRELLDENRIRMQVIPQTTLCHPNPGGSFRVMTLRDGRIVGHEEYLSGVDVVSGPQVHQLVELFGNLQGEALSTRASDELIDAIRKEL